MMKSSNVKRSIGIVGRRTCVNLEDPFWELLKEIAHKQGLTRPDLVARIDKDRQQGNLSSATRLFVLGYVRDEIARCAKVAKPRTRKKDRHHARLTV